MCGKRGNGQQVRDTVLSVQSEGQDPHHAGGTRHAAAVHRGESRQCACLDNDAVAPSQTYPGWVLQSSSGRPRRCTSSSSDVAALLRDIVPDVMPYALNNAQLQAYIVQRVRAAIDSQSRMQCHVPDNDAVAAS